MNDLGKKSISRILSMTQGITGKQKTDDEQPLFHIVSDASMFFQMNGFMPSRQPV